MASLATRPKFFPIVALRLHVRWRPPPEPGHTPNSALHRVKEYTIATRQILDNSRDGESRTTGVRTHHRSLPNTQAPAPPFCAAGDRGSEQALGPNWRALLGDQISSSTCEVRIASNLALGSRPRLAVGGTRISGVQRLQKQGETAQVGRGSVVDSYLWTSLEVVIRGSATSRSRPRALPSPGSCLCQPGRQGSGRVHRAN